MDMLDGSWQANVYAAKRKADSHELKLAFEGLRRQ
jgi:hypothetical protein